MIATRAHEIVHPALALITSRFPYGPKETFLRSEIVELGKSFELSIFAALPDRTAENSPTDAWVAPPLALASPVVVRDALVEFCRSPRAACGAFWAVVQGPRAFHARVKNALVFPKALALARLARARSVRHVHAYWLSTPATIAYVIARLNGISWSATGHRYDLVDFNVCSGRRPRGGFVASARFVRVVSERGRALVGRALADRSDVPVFTGHLGVDVPRELAPLASGSTLRLICAANLERVKGHVTLLRALQRCAADGVDVHCTIAGEGTEGEHLRSLANRYALDERVSFVGVLPHDRLLATLRNGAFDAAVLTSIDEGPHAREGIPVFLIECMAAGVPVVATRSGSVAELIADECSGLLCPVGDAASVAAAIARLARDEHLRDRLRREARATIERHFDVTRTARTLARSIGVTMDAVDVSRGGPPQP